MRRREGGRRQGKDVRVIRDRSSEGEMICGGGRERERRLGGPGQRFLVLDDDPGVGISLRNGYLLLL